MSLVGYQASNHPQQVKSRGAKDATDDRGTDQAYFDAISERFGGFTLDVAAAAHNAKCERWFGILEDGLAQHWSGRVWCNPPYSNLGAWVGKAWDEFAFTPSGRPRHRGGASLIVMLLPANRVEQAWWQDCVEPFRDKPGSPLRVEFLRGRLRFDRPSAVIGPKGDRPPFGCALLIWSAPNASVPKESAS